MVSTNHCGREMLLGYVHTVFFIRDHSSLGTVMSEVEIVVEVRSRTCSIQYKRSIFVRYPRNLASPRVSTYPKGSAQSLSQLAPTAQWGRLRKKS